MTSEQIDIDNRNGDILGPSHIGFRACAHWLKEIAYQLALFNDAILPTIREERERTLARLAVQRREAAERNKS